MTFFLKKYYLLLALIPLLFFSLNIYLKAVQQPFFGAGTKPDDAIDFTAHLNTCKQVWKGRVDDPYSESGQRACAEILEETPVVSEYRNSLFPYPPNAILYAGALVFIPTKSAYLIYEGAGFCLWVILLAELSQLLNITRSSLNQASFEGLKGKLACGLILLSFPMYSATAHTPFLLLPLTGLVILSIIRPQNPFSSFAIACGVTLVCAKPQLGLFLLLILLGTAQWRALFYLIGLNLLVLFLINYFLPSLLTLDTLRSYVWITSHYHFDGLRDYPYLQHHIPYFIHSGIVGLLTCNLVIQKIFISKWIVSASQIIWLFGSVFSIIRYRKNKIDKESFLATQILLFLLFSPIIYLYEDIALILVVYLLNKRLTWGHVGMICLCFSILPTVKFICNFPISFLGSWYVYYIPLLMFKMVLLLQCLVPAPKLLLGKGS